MRAVFVLVYLGIGIAQIRAGGAGIQLYCGVGSFVSFVLFVFSFLVPVIGSLLSTAAVYYGAHHVWHWEWWQALALAVPGMVFWLAIGPAAIALGLLDRFQKMR